MAAESRGFRAALGFRNFRLLLAGQAVSNLGDWIDYLALAILIAYVWHKGPASLAALAIVIAIPWIVVAPFAGVLADRWPRRTVMVGSDLARAALVTGFIFAPNLWVLLVLVFAKTVFSTLFSPAEQATIRSTVPDENLHAANALSQLVMQSSKVGGPAIGGLIVGLSSPHVAFGVDAVSFVGSAALLSLLRPIRAEEAAEHEEASDEPAPGFFAELREGFAYIASRRALVFSIAGFAAVIFLLLAFDSLSPLAFRELGVSRALFGLAVGAIGLGGVLGATAVGRYAENVNPFVLMGGGSAIIGGLVALMGIALLTNLDAQPFVWAPVLLGVGFASAGVLIASPTILQRETPPALMGRVSATATSLPTVCQVAAPIAGAALARWQSVGFVFAAAGGGLALLGAVVLAIRLPVGVGLAGRNETGEITDAALEALEVVGFVQTAEPLHDFAPPPRQTTNEEKTMADLNPLIESGMAIDELPPEQREALKNLDQSEVEALAAIRAKLNAEPEVSGYAMTARADGNLVW